LKGWERWGGEAESEGGGGDHDTISLTVCVRLYRFLIVTKIPSGWLDVWGPGRMCYVKIL
jgi:hypothetical protein